MALSHSFSEFSIVFKIFVFNYLINHLIKIFILEGLETYKNS